MERSDTVQEATPDRGSAYRLLVAVIIMTAAMVIAAVLVSTRHYLIPVARILAQHGWVKDRTTMDIVLTLGLLAPAALLAGLASGRRYRWVAASPAFLWIVVCWGRTLRARSWWPGDDLRGQLLFAAVWPLGAALLLHVLAVLGARLGRVRGVRTVVALALVAAYVWLAALAASTATMGTAQVLGLIAVVDVPAAALVVTANADRRIRRHTTRFLLGILCGASVFLDLATIAATGTIIAEDRAGLAAAGAAAIVILVLAALLVRYRGTAESRESKAESAG